MIFRHPFFATSALAATVLFSAPAQAQVIEFYSEIDGAQAGTGSPGIGSASLTMESFFNQLDYNINFSGLLGTETVAHIHGPATPGSPGGIVHTLPLGSPKIGTWNYPQSMEAFILSGLFYINIHSSVNGGGEIRGQIMREPLPYCSCSAFVSPCSNPGLNSGCMNSTGSGSGLTFSGLPSIALDTLTIQANTPASNGIFFMSQNQSQSPFGDGLRCVGSPTYRYRIQSASGGQMTLGPGIGAFSNANFAAFGGGITAGQEWNFQAWFRDNSGPCASGFNTSNALNTVWGP